ncbi:hypothetical protein ACO22_02524 [Paracoccidioides brasiliensis]|uniref:GPI anchored protein n=1 Tax=Paracoccidioides brasiliensis TaxID=121759 RepID=A0A1D2JIK2_PARBR|nr:hypothetical protein ACO22_02524 [Paracoccidioides brasiliensis]
MRWLPSPAVYQNHHLVLFLLHASKLLVTAASATGVLPNDDISDTELVQERLVQRDVEIQKRLADQSPVGVRKMSDDEGEKFWLDYWYFGDDDDGSIPQQKQKFGHVNKGKDSDNFGGSMDPDGLTGVNEKGAKGWEELWMNRSMPFLYAPLPLHAAEVGNGDGADQDEAGERDRSLRGWMARDQGRMFRKRDFRCPADTEPCMSINRPNSCCGTGSKCILVQDRDVGCCGRGDECSGHLIECPKGFRECRDYPGGGCCIPGYSCVDQGCIYISTTIITAIPPPLSPPPPSPLSPYPTTTNPIDPPYRRTSNPTTTITTIPSQLLTNATPETPIIAGCPTGFYACSAVHHGGCCRIGLDCNPTSCPEISSATIVDANGFTVVVPVDATYSSGGARARRCAGGWTSCAASAGGGCCPDGFVCGHVSCTASGGDRGTAVVGKTAPENGVVRVIGSGVSALIGIWFMVMIISVAW